MSSRLASMLVQEGHVSPTRMAEVFQRQVIYGGTLDTVLLEMGLVDEGVLLDVVSRSSGLPALEDVPKGNLKSLGRDLPLPYAERYQVVPVASRGTVLEVAVLDPPNQGHLDRLAALLGVQIEARVTLELLMHLVRERAYSLPLPARFATLWAKQQPRHLEMVLERAQRRGRRLRRATPEASEALPGEGAVAEEAQDAEAQAAAEMAAAEAATDVPQAVNGEETTDPLPAEPDESAESAETAEFAESTELAEPADSAEPVESTEDGQGLSAASEEERVPGSEPVEPAAPQETLSEETTDPLPAEPAASAEPIESAASAETIDDDRRAAAADIARPAEEDASPYEEMELSTEPVAEARAEAEDEWPTARRRMSDSARWRLTEELLNQEETPGEEPGAAPLEASAPTAGADAGAAAPDHDGVVEAEMPPEATAAQVAVGARFAEERGAETPAEQAPAAAAAASEDAPVEPTPAPRPVAEPPTPPSAAAERTGPTPLPLPLLLERSLARQREAAQAARRPANGLRLEPGGATPFSLSIEDGLAMLDEATERDVVFETLCCVARSYFDMATLFVVQGERATARVGLGKRWLERTRLGDVVVPLDEASAFRTTVEGRSIYIGQLGNDRPTASALAMLGRPVPARGALFPVVMRSRVVAVLLGDAGNQTLDALPLADMTRVMAEAAQALNRLILRAKSGEHRTGASATPAPAPAPAPAGAAEGGEDRATSEKTDRLPVLSGKLGDNLALLVDLLAAGQEGALAAAEALVAAGESGAMAVAARVPGPLRLRRFALAPLLAPLSTYGPLLGLVSRFGKQIVPHLVARLVEPAADVRFYAALAFSELRFAEAVRPLSTLLFDEDMMVRRATAVALSHFPPSPELFAAVESLRRMLSGPDVLRQRMAVDALGELRDVASGPRLIELLSSRDELLRRSVERALVTITLQDFGASRMRWRSWWEENRQRQRTDWLLDGLNHSNAAIRQTASDELAAITSETFGFHVALPWPVREEARQRWLRWYRQNAPDTSGPQQVP